MSMGRGILSMIQTLFFCLLLLSAPGTVKAAAQNLYIAQNAVGSGNGSSCANAKAVSFFNTAANWGAAATQIGPGTTVHLCGTISSQLTARGSGASGSPITILFESAAKISLPACDSTNGCLSIAKFLRINKLDSINEDRAIQYSSTCLEKTGGETRAAIGKGQDRR